MTLIIGLATDLDSRTLPDELTLPVIPIALVYALAGLNPLVGGQVDLLGVTEQRDRVGDETLLARRRVEHPQAVDRIVAGARADEHDPLAVGGDGEVARLAGEEVVHADDLVAVSEEPVREVRAEEPGAASNQ